VTVQRLLGAALTVPVLLGGLLLMTAGPAAACTCVRVRSEAERVAGADAIFVGTLVSQVDRTDRAARAELAELAQEPGRRSDRFYQLLDKVGRSSSVVLTFEVSRVYKGTVGKRQEIVTPAGGEASCGGFGIGLRGEGPFLVFAHNSAGDRYRLGPGQYASSLCSGSRALADGGEPPGGLRAREPGGHSSPSTAKLAVGVGLLAAVVAGGLAILRTRHRPSAD
jgi:hypothetical protein